MRRQFAAMETALGNLRNQSNWLAGQLASLPTSNRLPISLDRPMRASIPAPREDFTDERLHDQEPLRRHSVDHRLTGSPGDDALRPPGPRPAAAEAALGRRSDLEGANGALIHAQEIVWELAAGLDPTKWSGGPALAALYQFIIGRAPRRQHQEGRRQGRPRSAALVEPLADAWHQAADLAAAPHASRRHPRMTDWAALLDAIDAGLDSFPPVLVDALPADPGPVPPALAEPRHANPAPHGRSRSGARAATASTSPASSPPSPPPRPARRSQPRTLGPPLPRHQSLTPLQRR